MVRDSHNVIPVTLALLLHVLLFGSLLVVIDFGDRAHPAVPLAIKGTLVTDNAIVIPPKVEEIVPPEPDTSEQDRLRAEQQKRREDARIEQERLSRIEQARKQAEADAEKHRQAEEERKERERVNAEQERLAKIARDRLENERLRAEAALARQAELDAETNRLDAMTATAEAAYMFAIRQRVMSRWVQPPTATAGIECIVHIKQLPGGEVVSVSIGRCNGDSAVRRSIEAAVHRASPLPTPADPSVFDRNLRLEFKPTD